jgi:hypothetical protein
MFPLFWPIPGCIPRLRHSRNAERPTRRYSPCANDTADTSATTIFNAIGITGSTNNPAGCSRSSAGPPRGEGSRRISRASVWEAKSSAGQGGPRGLSAGDRPPHPANDRTTETGTSADAAETGTHAHATVVEVCTGVLVGRMACARCTFCIGGSPIRSTAPAPWLAHRRLPLENRERHRVRFR